MRLQPVEIYQFALEAGFSPDQAVTMTAIALAESGGNPNALNPVGENSIGLWQVNREAHPKFLNADGTDPLTNAQMAYEVSGGGADIGRWTVTHADKGAAYLKYRAQAEAAAASAGYPDATGSWDPPENYYSPKVSAGPAGDAPAPAFPTGDGAGVASDAAAAAPTAAAEPAPQALDSDSDGLIDAYEQSIGTDSLSGDTDRDGFSDSVEQLQGTNPLDFADNLLVGSPEDGEPGVDTDAPPLTTATAPEPQVPPAGPGLGPGQAPAQPQPPLPAAAQAPPSPVQAQPLSASPDPLVAEGTELDTFLDAALSQQGATYIYGSEESSADPDPLSDGEASYDCSSLVRWAAAQAGVDFTNGSYLQYLDIQQAGTELSVDEALRTPGALVFNFSTEPVPGGGRPSQAHVAISLGDGRLMEARGSKYDVGVFDAEGREFSHAGFIPELGTELAPESNLVDLEGAVLADPLPALPESNLLDTDGDGLIDAYERMIGADPFSGDTDRDGFLDSNELLYGSDPLEFADNPLVGPAGEGPDIGVPLTTEVPSNLDVPGQDELIDRGFEDDLLDAGLDSGLDPDVGGDVDDDFGDAGNLDPDVDAGL